MSKPTRAEREGFAALDRLYASLPAVACQRQCAIACGPIVLTDLEARRLQLATHIKPRTTAAGRCVYLAADDRCTVHPIRPLICRVWGVVQMLSCMHGCVPARWLGVRAYLELAVAVERVGGGRVLRTGPEGLLDGGESFATLAGQDAMAPVVDDAQLERDAERTRHLRALYGGRIILATETKP